MAGLKDRPDGLLGRRDLLSRATRFSLGAASLGGVFAVMRPLWPRGGQASALRLEAGRPGAYKVGEVGDALFREHWVWVIRDASGFYALSARCTHLGCRLRYAASMKQFHCHCHGSTFSLEGDVLRGPAVRHLERVFVTLSSEGMLLVDPDVRYRREHGEWDRPGAFVRYPGGSG